ncbi:SDR family NAD(P)-dependent oxidoreductase [Peristeroidobacter soli]|uniref:SDR family NAD(P)-dependent oxidoreductase n=1 Tax=Peristeroidobacter soli TaxID=2497877 RepID=UPI00101D1873|nr:SDR family oxidoreductase [Peristeroidobacter soli]
MLLHNVTTLVSGAAGGIGAAICYEFRRAGAVVIGLDVSESSAADLSIICNVAEDASVRRATDLVRERKLRPTVIVHAAAICESGGTLQTSPIDFLRAYDVNVVGAVRLVQAFVPAMRERGEGSIVLVSSINSQFATPSLSAYAASKGALDNLTRTLSLELAPDGIRVNAVRPASIDTAMLRRGLATQEDPEAALARNIARHPLGRLGTPQDAAQLVLFLSTPQASWITGACIPIDGGASVTRS